MSIVTYRGRVNAWECDHWGHQNVAYYLAKAADAQAALCCELGLAPSWLRERRAAPITTRQRIVYKRELRAGDPVLVRSGVRGADGPRLRYWSVLSHAESNVESALFDVELMLADRDAATPIDLPADVRARTADLARSADSPVLPAIDGPRAPDSTPATALLSHRGAIGPWEYDDSGFTAPQHQVAHFTQGVNQLLTSLGLSRPQMLERRIGTAALDYAVEYRVPLRPGDLVDMRSGVLEIRPKVLRTFHHLIDTGRGQIATGIEIAFVFFDLDTRKSIAMPAEFASAARELLARV